MSTTGSECSMRRGEFTRLMTDAAKMSIGKVDA